MITDTCAPCYWYRCEAHITIDYEGTTTVYHHLCYKDSPCTRSTGHTDTAPPSCCEMFVERAK